MKSIASIVTIVFFGLIALTMAMPKPEANPAVVPLTYSGFPVHNYGYPYSYFYSGYPYAYGGNYPYTYGTNYPVHYV